MLARPSHRLPTAHLCASGRDRLDIRVSRARKIRRRHPPTDTALASMSTSTRSGNGRVIVLGTKSCLPKGQVLSAIKQCEMSSSFCTISRAALLHLKSGQNHPTKICSTLGWGEAAHESRPRWGVHSILVFHCLVRVLEC